MIRAMLVRLVVNVIAIGITAQLMDGISYGNFWDLLLVAIVFGVVNFFLNPLLVILTCPLQIITLGLFMFVVNAVLLWLTSFIAGILDADFVVDSFFWTAIVGAFLISLINLVLSWFIDD